MPIFRSYCTYSLFGIAMAVLCCVEAHTFNDISFQGVALRLQMTNVFGKSRCKIYYGYQNDEKTNNIAVELLPMILYIYC